MRAFDGHDRLIAATSTVRIAPLPAGPQATVSFESDAPTFSIGTLEESFVRLVQGTIGSYRPLGLIDVRRQ